MSGAAGPPTAIVHPQRGNRTGQCFKRRTIELNLCVKIYASIYASDETGTFRTVSRKCQSRVTVGTVIADRPPYRSVRAELPHTALTLDGWRQNERRDRDAGHGQAVAIARRSGECASNWGGCADCDGPT